MIKNSDAHKYGHSGYGNGFDAHKFFSLSNGSGFFKNGILFGLNNSSSVHANSKKKYIPILGKGPTDGLDTTTITAEAEYFINFTKKRNKFCQVCIAMEAIVSLC